MLSNDKNRGLTYTRNVAIKEARGEYIAILDSDDVAIFNRLELQYNFFQENPDFALCGGHGSVIDKFGKHWEDDRFKVPIGAEKVKTTLFFQNAFINSTVMYKTEVLRELNGYQNYAPAEDYEFFTRVSDRYPVNNLDCVLVRYRIHDNNTSIVQSEIGRQNVNRINKNQLHRLTIEINETTKKRSLAF